MIRPRSRTAAPSPAVVDAVFRALADPTRRNVIAQLSAGPSSVGELAAAHDMALPSFLEHLKVLEGAGLVRSRKVGRVRTCELAPERLAIAETWLDRQRAVWEARLDRLDAYLMSMKKEKSK
ncbi:MAG: ArsR/SmtB family transcription factor [Reyranellaceae bacterium]